MAKITLKVGGSNSFSASPRPEGTPTAASPLNQSFPPPPGQTQQRPLSITIPATPGLEGRTKIKLTPRPSLPPTPVAGSPPSTTLAMAPPPQPVIKSKAGRIHKPTAKKRANGDMDSDDEELGGLAVNGRPQAKKIKINLGGTPSTLAPPITPGTRLKVKGVGKPPVRPPGDGYDSEAEDREIDPVIEEQFILRMQPGEHCDYLRECIREKRIGIPKQMGGADIAMKWLDVEGGRRCMITIQGHHYAGVLLDLPTIIEGMKTWDKKAMVKSADICQMLFVFSPVKDEQEAKTIALPKPVKNGYRWPHGLTPPMHDCVNRRFRKRLSKMEIQNKDQEVERLLKLDKEAESTKYEFIDESKIQDGEEEEEYEEVYEDEEEGGYEEEDAEGEADAEGEVEQDYFGDGATQTQQPEEEDEDLDALFQDDFGEEEEVDISATATGATEAATPATATNAITPATQTADEAGAADEEEGESEEEESEEDAEEGEFGDEEGEDGEDGDQRDRIAGVRKEIAELEKKKAGFVQQLAAASMIIMKRRIEVNIKNTESEILLKRKLIGEGDDDE